jgi:hypothetical protein
MPGYGPYVGVDPDSPLGQLIVQVEALQNNFLAHLSDTQAHSNLSAIIQLDALSGQVTNLQVSVESINSLLDLHLNTSTDQHPQYLTTTRGDARYAVLAHTHDGKYVLLVDFSAHKNSGSNPHPQYVTQHELENYFYTAGFKSLAYQASNNVNITGGVVTNIDGLSSIYRYTGTSAAVHVVTHSLGQRYVAVQVIDAGTNLTLTPTSISFDSTSQLTITLASPAAIAAVVTG